MLKKLVQSLENNKPLENILRQRLSLKDQDIDLLKMENSILSERLKFSLAVVCENPDQITSNTFNSIQTSNNSCAISNNFPLHVESIAYNESGIYYI